MKQVLTFEKNTIGLSRLATDTIDIEDITEDAFYSFRL